ncbi:cell wall hydrolase [Maricaulaceae bacterium EIL42A08]|nr:cell wall hydrolase [Maricaulaceae bacterium EIL42A08]
MAQRHLIQRLKRATTGLAACAAVLVTAGAVTLAPERARQQDEAALWRTLAVNYLSDEIAANTEETIQFASFTLNGAELSPRTLDDLRSFDTSHLEAAHLAARERQCMAEAIYYEARSEGLSGQMAVAEVIMNRVRHSAYPNTVCDVVYQGSERTTGCQFTFTCDGSMERAPYGRGWARSQLVAEHALMGFARPVTNRATHYHTTEVDPYWNDSLVRTRKIGSHVFYRFPNRSERQLLIDDREA